MASSSSSSIPQVPTTIDQYKFLTVLNRDVFGKVLLAKVTTPGHGPLLVAVKVLEKTLVVENDEVERVFSERGAFQAAVRERNPFLMQLYACFQTEACLCYVAELSAGGNILRHLQDGAFEVARARLYAAETCLALQYLHAQNIVHRGVQLSAVLLMHDGHVLLSNFGLCKLDLPYGSVTSTFCGDVQFLAPEMLLGKDYGRCVDWWGIGIILYEMLTQEEPFIGEHEDDIYDAILASEPQYPEQMPEPAMSTIKKLLAKDPEQRAGSGPTDAQEIMALPFFHDLNWDDVYHKRIQPTFVPREKSRPAEAADANEAAKVEAMMRELQPELSQEDQDAFKDFDYTPTST